MSKKIGDRVVVKDPIGPHAGELGTLVDKGPLISTLRYYVKLDNSGEVIRVREVVKDKRSSKAA